MRSISKPTNILPSSQAWALRGSVFGRWPTPRMDFMRLKTNSICQRNRYHSRIWPAGTAAGNVDQTIKYSAHSNDSLVTVSCLRSEEHTSELQSLRHLVCR